MASAQVAIAALLLAICGLAGGAGVPAYPPPPSPVRARAELADTHVISFRQTDATCPSARSCPGSEGVVRLCDALEAGAIFDCTRSWSSGARGSLGGQSGVGIDDVREASIQLMAEECGKECSEGLDAITFIDTALVPAFS